MYSDQEGHRERRIASRQWIFDKTLNIPTLLAVIAAVVGIATFGIRTMSEQERRIDSVERVATSAKDDARRVELAQASQARAQADQLQNVRTEIRSDIKDLSGKIDVLLLSSAGIRAPRKE